LLWQGTVNGLALGGVYILMALGLTLVFGVTHIMQFAHGEVYMLGAYVVYFAVTFFGLNIWIALVVSAVAMACLGLVLNRFIFKPVKGQILPPIVASLGLTFILQSVALVGFGLDDKSMPRLADGSLEFLGGVVPSDRVVAVIFAAALMVLLYLFLKRSKYGQALIASAQNPQGAFLQGINSDQMAALSMAIACALGAAGGALTGAIFSLNPYMGTTPLIKGLVIIVLGGMGSLAGVIVGGIIVGLIDGIVPLIADPGTAAMLPLIIVILVLLVRPQGLFGHEE
ncbi:partial High-affinity branched-chain amino acid transport system permease protein LivH, partial [Anaerolineae bacterium]